MGMGVTQCLIRCLLILMSLTWWLFIKGARMEKHGQQFFLESVFFYFFFFTFFFPTPHKKKLSVWRCLSQHVSSCILHAKEKEGREWERGRGWRERERKAAHCSFSLLRWADTFRQIISSEEFVVGSWSNVSLTGAISIPSFFLPLDPLPPPRLPPPPLFVTPVVAAEYGGVIRSINEAFHQYHLPQENCRQLRSAAAAEQSQRK